MRRISDEVFRKLRIAVSSQDFSGVLSIFIDELSKRIPEEKCTPAVEEVIENFDFEKVHKIMEILDWRWAGAGSNELPAVPTVEKMKERVKNMFKCMEDQIAEECDEGADAWPKSVSTGGFRATIDDEYILEFILEEYETFTEDDEDSNVKYKRWEDIIKRQTI